MKCELPRIPIILLTLVSLGRSGVAPITSIHQSTANNERQKQYKHVFYGLNISNSTSLMPTINKSPHFDPTTTNARNITVLQGENAFLVCSVMDLGNNFVSWLRHSDMNLLSVGKLKYTQDPRYHIFHTHDEHEDTWTLKISQTRQEDEGIFECQISTSQPFGQEIYLKVIDPEVSMPYEDSNKFAKAGSNLNLTCFIRNMLGDGKVLKWTQNDQEINHQSARGGVFIMTEHKAATISHLNIKNLTMADSGQYSCSTSAKSRATVMLYVINGDDDDDIAKAVTFNKSFKTSPKFCVLFFVLLMAYRFHLT